ncbi:lamina-associated polypeptide 2, isoforms beta/gamma-like [Brachionichthys hirsutus]|uniref:lamina-associated polypeptide 2, isoforms beta/gamma-like n=1 Tax=Brachionichthys hirsutus TaxID=412623 RepID=UPI003604DB81
MPKHLDEPSSLTKERLKGELLAHSGELPSGNATEDVYVQLYRKNRTAQNRDGPSPVLDALYSDEELPPPVVSSRSRSSGRKAIRERDEAQPEQLDVSSLTDQALRDQLLQKSAHVGPIVASTRKLYEKQLLKLLDARRIVPELVLKEAPVNHNGNAESELYSDKEDEVTREPEAEPVPVVERRLRGRGGAAHSHSRQSDPVGGAAHSHSRQSDPRDKIPASDRNPKVREDVLKELFPNNVNSPTGITATCRRPIKGAAGRPATPTALWRDENFLFFPRKNAAKTTSASSCYAASSAVGRVPSSSPSMSPLMSPASTSSSSRPPSAAQAKAPPRSLSLWMKLLLLAVVTAFLFFLYQAMESNSINPFAATE